MPLPHIPGAPVFCGSDMTMFLHKVECLAHSTQTDTSSQYVIYMFQSCCTEGLNEREKVIMRCGYEHQDLAAPTIEMLDAFWYTDS